MRRESIYDRMTRAEKEVAKVLKEFGIQWSYEQPVFVWDENERPRVWAPDFFLKHLGIYVEVCGSEKFDYNYRRVIFEKNGYQVIFLHLFKETSKWKNHLLNYLQRIMDYRSLQLENNRKRYDSINQ
ncbi:MAG: hypothetical protein QXS02_01860 [Candidatus Thermoplasmatota archaeon]